MSTSSPTFSPVTSRNTAWYPTVAETPLWAMLMPRIAVTVTVMAMKIADLMTGPVRLLRFMPASSG